MCWRFTGSSVRDCSGQVDQACLCYGLERVGIAFERQIGIPLVHRDMRPSFPRRADADLTYLRLSGCRTELLMNFNACG